MASWEEAGTGDLIVTVLAAIASIEAYYSRLAQGDRYEEPSSHEFGYENYAESLQNDEKENLTIFLPKSTQAGKPDYLPELTRLNNGLLDGACIYDG